MSERFDAAVAAYKLARSREVCDFLDGDSNVEACLLRARVSLHLGRWEQCLVDLPAAFVLGTPLDIFVQSNLLRAAAQTQRREIEKARATLSAARPYAMSSSDRALEAEYHYYETMWHFANNDLASAEASAQNSLHCDLEFGVVAESVYFMPIGITKARALTALGVVAGAREDYFRQARFLRDAIRMLEQCAESNDWTLASVLMNLSYSARDLDLDDDAAIVRNYLDRAWSPDVSYQIHELYRSLGWNAALRGSARASAEIFAKSVALAPTVAHALLVRTEREHVRREFMQAHDTNPELDDLLRLAAEIDWEKTGEERFGLVVLAREFVSSRSEHSRRLFTKYKALTSKLAPRYLDNRDRRVIAFERLTEGSILRSEAKPTDAIRALLDAFEIWDSVGYRWRAATASIELAELTRLPKFIDYAKREASLRPSSWLAARASRLSA